MAKRNPVAKSLSSPHLSHKIVKSKKSKEIDRIRKPKHKKKEVEENE